MRTPTRLAAYAATLGTVFGGAALAGAALGPLRTADAGHGDATAMSMHGEGHTLAGPAGLAATQDGYTLVPDATILPLRRPSELAFRIVGQDGRAVTSFDVEHTRRMHLIVVRRDLTGYQHLHPRLGADGSWRVRLRLPEAGVYRAYADFSINGTPMTLATDLFVAGAFAPVALAEAVAADTAGAYRAEFSSSGAVAGETVEVDYALSRDGRALRAVEPYLGADGHLVAIREGDMAFLHLHPEQSDTPGTIRFVAALPTAGRYRLFLQFKHDGHVRTVAHTLEVSR